LEQAKLVARGTTSELTGISRRKGVVQYVVPNVLNSSTLGYEVPLSEFKESLPLKIKATDHIKWMQPNFIHLTWQ
jgi:hypothetical protein